MIKFIVSISLVTVQICCAASAEKACIDRTVAEKVVHNGFFGDMTVINIDANIKCYDDWAKTHSNSLVQNFIDLCCDLTQTKIPDKTERFGRDDSYDDVLEYVQWSKVELQSELEQITHRPNGVNLLKVIASKYIEEPTLEKVCFLAANVANNNTKQESSSLYIGNYKVITQTTTTSIPGEVDKVYKATKWEKVPKYIVYVNRAENNAMCLTKSGEVKAMTRTRNDVVTHEVIHWKDHLLEQNTTNLNNDKHCFITKYMKYHKDAENKVKDLFANTVSYMSEEHKRKMFGCKYNDTVGIFMDFVKLLDHMLDDEYELRCMYGVVIDEKNNVVGWDSINEMTTNTDGNVRVSHVRPELHTDTLSTTKMLSEAIGYTAVGLQRMFKFYAYTPSLQQNS